MKTNDYDFWPQSTCTWIPDLARITLFCVGLLILAPSCNKNEEIIDDECCPWCVGPEGGEVEITDSENTMVGVKVVIPPGAWDHCRALSIEEQYVYAPPFPAGFKPYGGYKTAFGIQAGGAIPDSLYLEIHLPLHDLSYETGEILCAFYFDESADRWRIMLPDEVTKTKMIIKTPVYRHKWSWGIVSLADADWDKDLEPLLADLHGNGRWEALKTELTNIYQDVIEDDMDLTCSNVTFVRTFFETLRKESESWLVHYQDSIGNGCRICDVTSWDFYDGYLTYIEKKIEYFFIKLMFFDTGPNLLIMAYGFMRLCEIMADIEDLTCDYACFFSHCNDEFRATHAAYMVSTVLVYLIDYAISTDYVDCG
jgi:hypothetical protein